MGKTVIINDDGIREEEDNFSMKKGQKKSKIAKKISAITPLLSALAFLILGFCFDLWHPGWVVFLLIPLVEIIISIPEKGKGKWTSIAFIVSVIGYLLIGFLTTAWHPGWLIFFLIPITAVIVD